MSEHTDNERREAVVDMSRFVRLLDSCKYWQGISECDCESPLPIGGCLRCDMNGVVELLTQIIEANSPTPMKDSQMPPDDNVDSVVRCDGSCEEHVGIVKRVHVYDPRTRSDWGEFDYCDAAIAEDESRGFRVEIVTEKKS
jgi:hypothetical protein